MDENDDITKHIEDITWHWPVEQNGNSIQQLIRVMKDMDFSIRSENVLHIKNRFIAGDSVVGDIKSNNDADVKWVFSGATINQLTDNLRNIPDLYPEMILMIGTND